MPWKLVLFLIILTIVVLFISFNIGNTSDISFGFTVYEDVPIFISLFFSFLAGIFIMVPYALFSGRKKLRDKVKVKKEKGDKNSGKMKKNESVVEEKTEIS